MKKFLFMLMVLAVLGLVAPVNAAYYIAGDFNGWNAAGNLMTETSGGIWSVSLSGITLGRHEFKVTNGMWSSSPGGWNYPSNPNSWLYADASGKVTITFNANTVSDGWQPAQNRIGLSSDPGTWTIAGDFQGWNNANLTTAMTSLGHGFHKFTIPAGNVSFKPVVTGTWDSISWDNRSVGTTNYTLNSSQTTEFYVDAFSGTVGIGVEITRDYLPHDPDPNNLEKGVFVSGLELSWAVAKVPSQADPNVLAVDPNLVAHKLYMSDGSGTNPNLYYVGTIPGWNAETLCASYTPSPVLNKDSTYQWRVDMVMNDSNDIQGFIWTFSTEITTPVITDQTVFQIIDSGTTAVFSVTVTSPSPITYQWYKYVDGINDTQLTNSGDISGVDTDTLSIANTESADEGKYYCIVNNDSGKAKPSTPAPLAIKRRIAYWPFESSNPNSTVAGSPVSVLYHDPAFVTTGIVGDAMEFDNDPNSEDILYTDPDQASYFDICNYSTTVACWIKSSFAATWGPMVARNGEENGWQLRHRGDTLDRVCFTTRGTGNDDGTASNRTVYDGNWHYVVATYDGAAKKVYIDGIISRVYSSEDGSIARESDATSGAINATLSPVALAGRVTGDPISGLVFDGSSVTPCILDEVEIYNYALDAATIAQNYADTAGKAVCPVPQLYDLNGDCIVNLDDFVLLASEWLSDISVQPTP